MDKIRKKVKNKRHFDKLMSILTKRIKDNKPISANGMYDGLVISFMLATEPFTLDLFMNRDMGNVLDGIMQKLEHVASWIMSNEETLCDLMK